MIQPYICRSLSSGQGQSKKQTQNGLNFKDLHETSNQSCCTGWSKILHLTVGGPKHAEHRILFEARATHESQLLLTGQLTQVEDGARLKLNIQMQTDILCALFLLYVDWGGTKSRFFVFYFCLWHHSWLPPPHRERPSCSAFAGGFGAPFRSLMIGIRRRSSSDFKEVPSPTLTVSWSTPHRHQAKLWILHSQHQRQLR